MNKKILILSITLILGVGLFSGFNLLQKQKTINLDISQNPTNFIYTPQTILTSYGFQTQNIPIDPTCYKSRSNII